MVLANDIKNVSIEQRDSTRVLTKPDIFIHLLLSRTVITEKYSSTLILKKGI